MAQILIADDEEGFRFLLKRTLETFGHEVREAGDGDAAVATLRTYPAQLAIVDLFMPGKEGIETIIEIRRRHPEVKVVAISGGAPQTGTSFLGVAKKLGAHQTLTKPFSADELLLVVSHLLGCTSFTSSPPACAPPTPAPAAA